MRRTLEYVINFEAKDHCLLSQWKVKKTLHNATNIIQV